eukprot:TRINITY_DN27807_c0_g1_i1.p1 TRINITY_DN27807_c0_g1~~TRINITY_DN27807_c0_g1_i1.p1  ORF type:complete len:216 (+),score=57.03 TRINITY_DN27807_c0_g1_i1:219-866(+)
MVKYRENHSQKLWVGGAEPVRPPWMKKLRAFALSKGVVSFVCFLGCLGLVLMSIGLAELRGLNLYVEDTCDVVSVTRNNASDVAANATCRVVTYVESCNFTTFIDEDEDEAPLRCAAVEELYEPGANFSCYTWSRCPVRHRRFSSAYIAPLTEADLETTPYAYLSDPDPSKWMMPTEQDWYVLGPAFTLTLCLCCAWVLGRASLLRVQATRELPF